MSGKQTELFFLDSTAQARPAPFIYLTLLAPSLLTELLEMEMASDLSSLSLSPLSSSSFLSNLGRFRVMAPRLETTTAKASSGGRRCLLAEVTIDDCFLPTRTTCPERIANEWWLSRGTYLSGAELLYVAALWPNQRRKKENDNNSPLMA